MSESTSTALETRDRDKVPVAFGVAPGTLDEAWRWANNAAASSIVPKDYRGKPADILVAMQLGAEVGFAPMTALQSIAVINGRPGLFGDGLLALVMASPVYVGHDEWYEVLTPGGSPGYERRAGLTAEDLKHDATRAVCLFRRKGRPEPVTRTFSLAQAKRAQLTGKAGPWTEYPDRMLLMRARGFAVRDAFPDVLKGLRTAEELADMPVDDAPSPAPVVVRKSDAAE